MLDNDDWVGEIAIKVNGRVFWICSWLLLHTPWEELLELVKPLGLGPEYEAFNKKMDRVPASVSEESRRNFFKQIIHQNLKKAYKVECDRC